MGGSGCAAVFTMSLGCEEFVGIDNHVYEVAWCSYIATLLSPNTSGLVLASCNQYSLIRRLHPSGTTQEVTTRGDDDDGQFGYFRSLENLELRNATGSCG